MAFAVVGAERGAGPLRRSPPGSDPFEYPQFPMRSWRVVGRWKAGGEFLVVLGSTQRDATDRVRDALTFLSRREFRKIASLWLEQWHPGSRREFPCWEPVRRLPVCAFRSRRSVGGRRSRSILCFSRTGRRVRWKKGA